MVGGRVLLLAIAVAEAAWLPALVAQGQLFSNARFPSNRYGQGAQKQHPPKAASLLNRMRPRPHQSASHNFVPQLLFETCRGGARAAWPFCSPP